MGLYIRTIGLARARTKIGPANRTYNMRRFRDEVCPHESKPPCGGFDQARDNKNQRQTLRLKAPQK
jgi:hypothetical protein